MTLQNSYIFLGNPYKKEEKKEKRTPDGAIILEVGKNVYSYISAAFPNLTKDKESINLFRREYGCSVQVGTDCCEVKFIINEVVDITYLDVVAEGKNKAQIIKCLEQVQDTLLSSGIRDEYIDIVSYDAISEYYCNKILPKLNALERNLRKLLFNIYIVKFGKRYFQATIAPTLQGKAKEIINKDRRETRNETKALYNLKNSSQAQAVEYLQNFFYSLELGDIKAWLFTDTCTECDKEAREHFLAQHKDLSKLTDEELREAFYQLSPKSDWERFFSSKIDIADIENMIERIRQHRNSIAHFKFFYKEAYTESNRLISQLNSAVLNAIKLTEDKDFAEKNAEYITNAMGDVLKRFAEMQQKLTVRISRGLEVADKVGAAIKRMTDISKYDFSAPFRAMERFADLTRPLENNILEETEPQLDDTEESEEDENV